MTVSYCWRTKCSYLNYCKLWLSATEVNRIYSSPMGEW